MSPPARPIATRVLRAGVDRAQAPRVAALVLTCAPLPKRRQARSRASRIGIPSGQHLGLELDLRAQLRRYRFPEGVVAERTAEPAKWRADRHDVCFRPAAARA